MNREIKFRAWVDNRVIKEMIYPKDVQIDSAIGYALQFLVGYEDAYPDKNNIEQWQKDIVFMQFTGLLDKNGKEIYEGDVIKHDLGLERFKKLNWQVVFEFGSFQLRTESEHNPVSFPYHAHQAIINNSILSQSEYCEHLEIIGNIYENPNLIN